MTRTILLGALAALTAGCIDEVPMGNPTVNGTYVLQTVNGSGLPYTVTEGETTTTVLDGALTLFQGGTYSESGRSRQATSGQVTDHSLSEAGSYELFGTSITFRRADGRRTRLATLNNKTLTIVESAMTTVYRK